MGLLTEPPTGRLIRCMGRTLEVFEVEEGEEVFGFVVVVVSTSMADSGRTARRKSESSASETG